MGDTLPEVVVILTRARNHLLSDSQQAAGQGDWGRAKALMELAERADRLREEVSGIAGGELPAPQRDGPESPPAVDIEEGTLTQRPPTRGGYPKYRVSDDALIKQGLQRGGHDVYEHAVPRERFDVILDHLADMADAAGRARQRPFSIEKVQKNLHCPRYMTYVVISFLLQQGLLIKARKGSYTFATPAAFRSEAAALWDNLKRADAK